MTRLAEIYFFALILATISCSQSSDSNDNTIVLVSPKSDSVAPKTTTNRAETVTLADVSILFLGNSHTRPIPELLEEIYADNQPQKKVYFRMSSGFGFLDEQAESEKIRNEITAHKWDFVVLQAQKYSTTGTYDYPIDGAVELARLATNNGSQVIMYPEFPRQGVDEYSRIRSKHQEIAEKTDVIIAPIGEAWKLAQDQVNPELLYSDDGNHASRKGYQLVARVLFLLTSELETAKQPLNASEFQKIAEQAVSQL